MCDLIVNGGLCTIFSEEHAKAHLLVPGQDPKTGDKIHLVPSHCCTTVNLHNKIYVVRKGMVEAIWPVTARGAY